MSVCVYVCGQWAQLEADCATEAEDPEKQHCLTKIKSAYKNTLFPTVTNLKKKSALQEAGRQL